ncbi:HEAT SHOCK PROTEIN 26 [Salix koriyanagi]|uniref:HEAT SHOCK PROTEIN 26 n=1 Tax=Salix koriyanagi TaxID=2511006 RepID=A0A9Q0TSR4_9ROSI|nr:HEAT SHOCK PROTEIN 26 [Salix koriyanagi]
MEAKPGATGAVAERVYEDFEPKMEWERELGDDTLRVHLPGFKKEQMLLSNRNKRNRRWNHQRWMGRRRRRKAPPPSESAPGPQKQPREKPTGDQQRQPGKQKRWQD